MSSHQTRFYVSFMSRPTPLTKQCPVNGLSIHDIPFHISSGSSVYQHRQPFRKIANCAI